MPTGTGKTETMLALLTAARLERLLVVVPSDALRTQIADKFLSLGVLQDLGVVSTAARRPVVGEIRHGFKSTEQATQFATACNVVVATPQVLTACDPVTRQALLDSFSHLFIDEAHHVAATTWMQLRDAFRGRPVVQFTATPFREDGKHIGGRLIYSFPLREAQRQGYFSCIKYISVLDLGNQDKKIAEEAVRRLRDDLAAGLDHLLMARVSRIGRAVEVLPCYQEIAADLQPVILHSTLSASEREAALSSIRARRSRAVICVNMLGEGFDLPALKVAAIHDPHKSLGVTLQFVGRFARTAGEKLGDASVVVGRAARGYDPRLRSLYAEDADWNRIIRDLSQDAIAGHQEVSDFEAAFGHLPAEVAMHSLLPKMSTVVYETSIADWHPEGILELFPPETLLTYPIAINQRDKVAWFVAEVRRPISWGDLKTMEEVQHHLYVVYWNGVKQLLYINSSDTKSHHEALAKVIVGDKARRITGENVYRVMANLKRLVPTNVGLLDTRNHSRRFSMHVGADVIEGFPIAEAQTKTKTNIFAYGYEDGIRVSVGASLKGRVWSHMVANSIKQWVNWCDHTGAKLTDTGISVDEVMVNFIRPEAVEKRPSLIPLGLEWPWQIYANQSEETRLEYAGISHPLVDIDFRVVEFKDSGPIRFNVESPDWSIDYSVTLADGKMEFTALKYDGLVRTQRSEGAALGGLLNDLGLYILFEKDTLVVPGALLLKPARSISPFPVGRLTALDWTGVDLSVESQGPGRREDSVQWRAWQHVLGLQDWQVILDDDGSGETADIVALRVGGDTLQMHLTHCKYVAGGQPRAQVVDLYEVCGQAQKSVRWRRDISCLLENLIRRERKRRKEHSRSGLLVGDDNALYSVADQCRMLKPAMTIAIAQPGLSRANASSQQLELLATTELYLREAANADFEVYCSP